MKQKLALRVEEYLFFPTFIQSILSILLLPLTVIYTLIVILKRTFARPIFFDIPIVSVGNLVVGGNFTHAGGGFSLNGNKSDVKVYILDSEAEVSAPGWSEVNSSGKVGDLDDFIDDETGSDLGDIVNDLIISVLKVNRWTGVNENWQDDINWKDNTPDSSSDIVISAPINGQINPVITADDGLIELNNITIEQGAVLTIKAGAKLTVNGNLTIAEEGGLLIENTAEENGMASLITNGDVNGLIETKMTMGPDRWFYLGSSRKDAVFSDFGAGEQGISISVFRNNKWWSIKETLAGYPMRSMEGLATSYMPEAGSEDIRVIQYSGEVYTDAVNRIFDEDGFHLFANPYTSYIDWDNTQGWEGRDDVDALIWYRTKVENEMVFVTYNGNPDIPVIARISNSSYLLSEITEDVVKEHSLIAPMQAIWIKTNARDASLTIKPSARTHGMATSRLKSSRSSNYNVIRIEAENDFTRDGTVIYFSEKMKDELDNGDAEKYFNDSENVPEIYTRVDSKALAINGMSELTGDDKIIPLSVQNKIAGDVTLRFDLRYFTGPYSVSLEDKETGTFVNLSETNTYNYSVIELGTNHDRFVIHLGYQPLTNVEPVDESEIDAEAEILTGIEVETEGVEDIQTETVTENIDNNVDSLIVDYSQDSEPMAVEEEDRVSTGIQNAEQVLANYNKLISIKSIANKVLVSVGIEMLKNGQGLIEIYTVEGRKVSEVPARSSRTLVFLPSESGVYIIRAQFGNIVKSERIVNVAR